MKRATHYKIWSLCFCFLSAAIITGCSGKEGRINKLIEQFSSEETVGNPARVEQAMDELVEIGGDAVPQLCRNLDSFDGLLVNRTDVNDLIFSIQTLKQIGIEHPETAEMSIPTLLRLYSKLETTADVKERAIDDPMEIIRIKGQIRGELIVRTCFSFGVSGIAPILDFIRDEGDDSPMMLQAGFAVNMILTLLQPASIDSLKKRVRTADDNYRMSLVKRIIRIIGSDDRAESTLQEILNNEKVPEIRAVIEAKIAELQ